MLCQPGVELDGADRPQHQPWSGRAHGVQQAQHTRAQLPAGTRPGMQHELSGGQRAGQRQPAQARRQVVAQVQRQQHVGAAQTQAEPDGHADPAQLRPIEAPRQDGERGCRDGHGEQVQRQPVFARVRLHGEVAVDQAQQPADERHEDGGKPQQAAPDQQGARYQGQQLVAAARAQRKETGAGKGGGAQQQGAEEGAAEQVGRMLVPGPAGAAEQDHAGDDLHGQQQGARRMPLLAPRQHRQQRCHCQRADGEQVQLCDAIGAQQDFAPDAAQQPCRGGRQEQHGQAAHELRMQVAGVPAEIVGHHQRGGGQQRAAEPDVGLQGRRRIESLHGTKEGKPGGRLHQQAEGPGQGLALAQADPDDARAFQRPGGGRPAAVEGERDGQGAEDDAQREEGFGQQFEAIAAPQRHGQARVGQSGKQRGKRQAEVKVPDQAVLQSHGRQWRAEDERAIHIVFQARRLARAVGDGDADIEQHEQDQEQLRRQVVLGCVAQQAPGGGDDEGEAKTQHIQHAPGTFQGDGEDARIEQRVIAEQADMVAAARRHQQGHGKAADDAEDGQPDGVLQHGQQTRERRQHEQHGKRQAGRDQLIQAEGAKRHQHQDRQRRALQRQADAGAAEADAPGPGQQGDIGQRDAGQAQLDGQRDLRRHVLEQEADAEEEDQQAQLGNQVARK